MKRLTAVLSASILTAASIFGDDRSSLATEMGRLGVRSVLVIASQAVDEHPVWSPDGNALAANVDGRWVKVDLMAVSLKEGIWHGDQAIGVANSTPMPPIAESIVRKWEESAKYGMRRVVARDGTSAELRLDALSTHFVITNKGESPETLWKTSLENCYGLALSPDENLVAFVCELNGVVVTRVR